MVERVFTRDIKDARGKTKYAAGALKDFPRPTWDQISANLGVDLDDYTTTKEAASAAGIVAGKAAATSTEKPERVVRRRANI